MDSLSVTGRDGTLPHNLSFRAHPGEVTVLRGPNGTGKSTTFLAILGALPDTDVSGRIAVGGEVAFLAAWPATVPGTVRENLELFGLPVTPTPLAPTVEPERFIDPASRGVSAGELQLIGLTRTLASSAPIVLLDEPTAHLSPERVAEVLDAIRDAAERGRTVLVASHDMRVAEASDKVVDL
ncbi:ATP-binding cassette domain-containing protein [Corynebacterium amycolatum]|uniref:ATP-binding cassette domain-containing protein n=1 Tax=Corynebacterium amycolatum TaxID=43765 RepID=UPI001CCA7EC9|nr:ABC transporter ATP-binding protein [Corynebacterium amycolatum]MCA0442722.1 ABC transporter ATP-binding protein [Corynebacterium amycolatum]